MKVIQTRLKQVFEALSVTPNAFALAHQIRVPTIYGIINGDRKPNFETLARICAAEPRISTDFLLRGEGVPLRSERQKVNSTTVEELKFLKDEMNQVFDKRISELGASK